LPWSTPFEDPIILPDGRTLLTLKDAADYITKLPKEESDLPEWQTAIEVLILCSRGGPTMMARIGVMRALNRGHVREFWDTGKQQHWGPGESSRGTNDRVHLHGYEQQVGDPDHLEVFANADAAETWFRGK
jgi:hypothetical protein